MADQSPRALRPLGSREILAVWDRALGLDPLGRARALAAAHDPQAEATLDRRPLGDLSAALLRARVALAGPHMAATADCPGCGEAVEFGVDAEAVLAVGERAAAVTPLDVGGWHVVWRLVTPADLVPGASAAALVAGCVESVKRPDGGAATADDLPPPVRAALAEALGAADPLAELVVELSCPGCSIPFATEVDLAAFVWAALDDAARRLLRDVDLLARVYGWTEDDVLALGDRRRACYVELALGAAS